MKIEKSVLYKRDRGLSGKHLWPTRMAESVGVDNEYAVYTEYAEYRGILADAIVYIFVHLHRALRTEGNMLDIN